MRHNKKFNHLSRTASHRDALLANLSVSLILHKRITTTVAKAKALKQYVEPLITRCKNTVAEKVAERPGGYTRIIKLGFRQGDAADLAFIELVDFDENMKKQQKVEKKTRRSRRSSKKEAPAAEAAEATAVEASAEEAPKSAPAEEAKADEAPKAE